MERLTTKGFLKRLASKKPTPGGGSVAALAGAMAAGLISMAAKYSGEKLIARKSERLMKVLITLIDEDAKAFQMVIESSGESRQEALKHAAEVPFQTARYSQEVLKLAEKLFGHCRKNVITDLGVGAKMAEASIDGALLNVEVNIAKIKDEKFKKDIQESAQELYLAGYRARMIINRI